MQTTQPLAITTGEPAGIGPEITIAMAASSILPQRMVILADRTLLLERAQCVGVAREIIAAWPDYTPECTAPVSVLHTPLATPSVAGQLNPANAAYVLTLLDRAIDGSTRGEFSAIVTAPIHKGVINEGTNGGYFSGHTEYLAEKTHTPQVVMMLAGEYGDQQQMRVALATTHLPLKDVANELTTESLQTTLRILHDDLQHKFGLAAPRIIVAGLNPHAGESGHMGREEIDVIIPVLAQLRAEGMNLIGPLPADTLFNPPILAQGDAVLAMYHDQGLPVLKFATFGAGINITLGLPIIRTSVDHGTALNIAGTGQADIGSLIAATKLAAQLAATAH
ncbi:4-hydroxythreonine-4-phosphate dehydrogenase PdxA [Chitinibacter bivalviorum]|uniref:4-hydroxythreonine-4-phosphate dehydrogenase n=1 Tax=Chitinibacter bivalviorum TaxID=2739434 RepID=A0A7H9BJE1_9NEIS|nr:4-hydroxythreonine-4-phosphate dehydrogenase PdxA [Chitinibacter bivalviorum]QLG88589.1 4-hydroxythreonine-4-phosphate dehydrogenase PdxA [Chitinibacter bivalviorum]